MAREDTPPDCSTITHHSQRWGLEDIHHLERPTTPFLRPNSPEPTFSSAATGHGQVHARFTSWPMDYVNPPTRARAESTASYTSRHVGAEWNHPMLRTEPSPSPPPIPLKSPLRAFTHVYKPHQHDPKPVQVPRLAHIAKQHAEQAMERLGSSGSLGTFIIRDDVDILQGHARTSSGLARQLSRGGNSRYPSARLAKTGNSLTSLPTLWPFVAPQSIRRTEISNPIDLHHVTTDSRIPKDGEEADTAQQPKTHSILLDVRTKSRLGNRTSLPVQMPAAISPLKREDFSAGCDENSSGYSHSNSLNPFDSPESPSVSVHRIQTQSLNASGHGHDHDMSRRVSNTTTIAWLGAMGREAVVFWTVVFFVEASLMVTIGCTTAIATINGEEVQIPTRLIVGLSVSVMLFICVSVLLTVLYARRHATTVIRNHRQQQRNEEMVEMGSMMRHSLQPQAHHHHDSAGRQHFPCIHMAQAAAAKAHGNLEPSNKRPKSIPLPDRLSQRLDATDALRPSMIGIARSDSLYRSASKLGKRRREPSLSSAGDSESYKSFESDATEKPIMLAQQFPARQDSLSCVSTPTSLAKKMDFDLPVPGDSVDGQLASGSPGSIPHSTIMADLRHSNDPPVSASNTKSTVSSILSSYAGPAYCDAPNTTTPELSMTLENNAPFSHPNMKDFNRMQIVTEVGTPESEKSFERKSCGYTFSNEPRDRVPTGLSTMTPIEERSEGASVYGVF